MYGIELNNNTIKAESIKMSIEINGMENIALFVNEYPKYITIFMKIG